MIPQPTDNASKAREAKEALTDMLDPETWSVAKVSYQTDGVTGYWRVRLINHKEEPSPSLSVIIDTRRKLQQECAGQAVLHALLYTASYTDTTVKMWIATFSN